MKILVTGGLGFIGSHVVDEYVENHHEVIIIDDLSTGSMKNHNPRAKFFLECICKKRIEKIFKTENPQIVNHHAAQVSVPVSVKNPLNDLDINIIGLLNILDNCVKFKVKKIIFISSGGAIYGDADEYPTSEKYHPKPLSPYAIHKFVSELYLYYYYKTFGLDYTILRYSNVYGPRQATHGESGVISIFVEKYLKGETPNLHTFDGELDGMIRDYVYVKDVVKANLLAINKASTETINIGSGIETTTGKLLRIISGQMGVEYKPCMKGPRLGDIRRSCLNIKRAKDILSWEPTYSLEKGLKETIEYFSL
ncbi:MAG: NAD-dependent epimerase/dehydratase family protein [Candidatus Cloacimonetes bacterium]|nr:NAD-dependent epimerase/dehydratase family protein [Candidatus Cloacimonadota bacterium]